MDSAAPEGEGAAAAAARLAAAGPADPLFAALMGRLAAGGLPAAEAGEQVRAWQRAQAQAQARRRAEEEAARPAEQRLRAIWSCAVCGRARLPYIVCHVAPCIVGYERINGSG